MKKQTNPLLRTGRAVEAAAIARDKVTTVHPTQTCMLSETTKGMIDCVGTGHGSF